MVTGRSSTTVHPLSQRVQVNAECRVDDDQSLPFCCTAWPRLSHPSRGIVRAKAPHAAYPVRAAAGCCAGLTVISRPRISPCLGGVGVLTAACCRPFAPRYRPQSHASRRCCMLMRNAGGHRRSRQACPRRPNGSPRPLLPSTRPHPRRQVRRSLFSPRAPRVRVSWHRSGRRHASRRASAVCMASRSVLMA